MREIKFRAWEKYLKEIIPVHNISLKNRMINTESAWRLFDEIELMQYTELKDKNGKEIYEGDILHCMEMLIENIPPYKAVIEWDKTRFTKRIIGQLGTQFPFITQHGMFGPFNNLDDFGCSYEVIGNIYENPELLNK